MNGISQMVHWKPRGPRIAEKNTEEMADSSPEKAGVGGPIPSLLREVIPRFCLGVLLRALSYYFIEIKAYCYRGLSSLSSQWLY
jgi:hypothetical protein